MNKRGGSMKWGGWGTEDVTFSDADKPALGPFLERHLDLGRDVPTAPPVPVGALAAPDPVLPGDLDVALQEAADTSTDPLDRVVHARGKSLRDLVRPRTGDLGRLPDGVVRPHDE